METEMNLLQVHEATQDLDDIEMANFLVDEIIPAVKAPMFADLDDYIELQERLAEIASDMEERIDELNDFNIKTEDDAIEAYDDMLNNCIEIPNDLPSYIVTGTAAEMMKENDPTMYRCGFNDFIDSLSKDGQCVPDYVNWSV